MVIGQTLVNKGIITQEQLNKALEYQKQHPQKKLMDILYDANLISKDLYLKLLANELNVNYVSSLDNLRLRNIHIPYTILKQTQAVPFNIGIDEVKIAMVNPIDWNAQSYYKRFFPDKKIEFLLAHKEDIEKALNIIEQRVKLKSLIESVKKELKGAESKGESAIYQLMIYIIKNAIIKKASDIHIEAEEDGAVVRFRILGKLREFIDFDYEIFNALDSRIKLEAKMDVSEKRKPQDGGFSLKIDENEFDFRVSTLPTIWGESIVIRILDKRNILKNLDDIGITTKNLNILRNALSKPNGIFLVTGPTGSGKSTTLYASLNEIAKPDVKVITVEDPVEYKLNGIQQVQVNPRAGITFASALRSILRQDPDIIMIGEIRDLETLEIAIKAALTGHLVLSTLHTNDSVSAISRMIDMGAEPFMVAAALVGVEAQRLVRTNCPYCMEPYKPSEAYLEPIRNLIGNDTVFYRGKGCEKCDMTGYLGRTLITEIFLNDDKLEGMIAKNKDRIEIMRYLESQGFKKMFFDGIIKAKNKVTTLEEVYRVAKI